MAGLFSKDEDIYGGEQWNWSQSQFSPKNDDTEADDDGDGEADDGGDADIVINDLVFDVEMLDDNNNGALIWRNTIEV